MTPAAYPALTSTLVLSCAWGAVVWSRRVAQRIDERVGAVAQSTAYTRSRTMLKPGYYSRPASRRRPFGARYVFKFREQTQEQHVAFLRRVFGEKNVVLQDDHLLISTGWPEPATEAERAVCRTLASKLEGALLRSRSLPPADLVLVGSSVSTDCWNVISR